MSHDLPPADPSVHLAVDLGASSGRVIAGVYWNDRLALHSIHRFENEPVPIQGSLQWDVVGLWRELLRGLRLASDQFPQVASVGVDTWGVDYVLLNSHDQVAGPVYCYRDARTVGMLERAFELVPRDEIFAATGLQFMELSTLYQLLAARRADDPALQIADGLLLMGDFFHWLLTGQRSIELTNASTTQLLDPRTKQWSADLLRRFGLSPRWFIDPLEPGTVLGPVQASVAAVTGLQEVPVVVPATHDTASAVLAVPADDFAPAQPTWCYISSGTWSLMGCELPAPMINARCAELNFTNEGGVAGSTRLLKNIGGLWVFQQLRKSMQRRGRDDSWDEMIGAARQARPFQLLLDPDDPMFVAPADMYAAIEAYAAKTDQAMPSQPGGLYRAALEGLALRYRACLAMLESLVDHRIETIHIVGGGALNELLCRMTAAACDRNVVAGPVEATAIGNLLMQLMGTGRLRDVRHARQVVRASFDTVFYPPTNSADWDEPARRFSELH